MAQTTYSSDRFRPIMADVILNGRNIPFVNHVKYLDVIFDKRIKWRLHIEMNEAKSFQTYIRVYSLFRSKRLGTNIKLALHKALIKQVMTYACSAWEYAEDIHLLKLQHLQNKVLRTTGNFPRYKPVRDLHMDFNLPYVYNYTVQATSKVLQNHENDHVHSTEQSQARHRKYKRFTMGGDQTYDRSSD
jgi:hypothetical protein